MKDRVKYIQDRLKNNSLALVKYSVGDYEILIKLRSFMSLDFSKLVTTKAMFEYGHIWDTDEFKKDIALRMLYDYEVLSSILDNEMYLIIYKDKDIIDVDCNVKKDILDNLNKKY